jgi:hypothetical protein
MPLPRNAARSELVNLSSIIVLVELRNKCNSFRTEPLDLVSIPLKATWKEMIQGLCLCLWGCTSLVHLAPDTSDNCCGQL